MREMKPTDIDWIPEMPATWDEAPNKVLMRKKKIIQPIYGGEDILSLTMEGVIVRDLDAGGKMPTSFDGYQKINAGNLLMCLFDYDVTPRCIGLIEQDGVTSPAYSQYVLSDIADANYYYYYYLMVDNTKELLHLAKNMRHSFSEEDFGRIKAPIPPLNEQKYISNFLDTKCAEIDALTADIQSQIDTLEQYKRSVITEVVTKGLDRNVEMKESGLQYWGEIPVTWDIVDIKYLFEIVKRIAGREGYDILSITQHGIKVRDTSTNEGQVAADYSNYQFLYPGEFAMNHMDLLTGWVDLSDKFGVTSPDYRVFRLRDTKRNSRRYYKYIMQICYMCRIFYSLGNGVSNLGRWRLQTSSFNNFKVPVPSYEEQEAIADYLDVQIGGIEEAIELKNEQLSTLDSLKKSLIYEYVTGKKEVPA